MRSLVLLGRATGAYRSHARSTSLSALVLGVLAAGLLLAAPAVAGTATTRPLVSSFNGSETPQASFGEFMWDIAVNESTGDIYVVDERIGSTKTVDVFDSTGKYLFQLDGSNTPQGSLGVVYGLAVDNSAGPAHGNLYVSKIFPSVVDVFDSAGNYLYQINGSDNPDEGLNGIFPGDLKVDASGDLFIATGTGSSSSRIYAYRTTASSASYLSSITIDKGASGFARDEAGGFYIGLGGGNVDKLDSAGNLLSILYSNHFAPALAVDPATGDLLVDDSNDVLEYGSSGTLVRRFAGTIEGRPAIAVDAANGDTYVADTSQSRVEVYGSPASATVPDLAIEQPNPSYFSTPLVGSVNPAGVPSSYLFEYKLHSATSWSSTTTQSAGNGTSAVPINVELSGLIQNTTYDVRLLGIATETGAIVMSATKTFTTPTVPPPAIQPVSSITDHSATFAGSVNPQGVSAGWHFEYSTDGVNWTKAPATDEDAGSGTSDVPVTFEATGLDPNTTYQVRLVATYLGGTGGSATSQEVNFTTNAIPPAVTTRSAFPVTDTSATLRGVVDPKHAATTYWFEYGSGDCSSNPCMSIPAGRNASAGSTLGPKAFAVRVEGLRRETTYHFRLVAKNQAGTAAGADMTFTTVSAAEAEWPARGIELVNTPEKATQPVGFVEYPGGFDDEHAAWGLVTGLPSLVSGEPSEFRATRTSTGWQSQSTMPTSTYERLVEALVRPDRLEAARGRTFVRTLRYQPASGTGLLVLQDNESGDEFGVDGYKYAFARVDSEGNFHVVFVELSGEVGGPDVASTEDLQRLYLESRYPYDPGQAPQTTQIYDVSDGTPALVSRLPDGTIPACGASFAGGLNPDGSLSNNSGQDQLIFFSSQGANCSGPDNLYVRDVEAKTTQLISGPPLSGDPEPAPLGNGDTGAHLIKISRDGRSALFSTRASLVAQDDADGNSEDTDVYRWTDGQGVKCLTCIVPDAAVGTAIASQDLSTVYFLSANQLVAGKGAQHPARYDNLYVYHDDRIDYVSPYAHGGGGDLEQENGSNTALVPDGRAIFFVSVAPGMTSDDPGDCGGEPCAQVYRYDRNTQNLECVSCRPAGAPSGPSFTTSKAGGIFGGASDDGHTFVFDSSYPLLPEDVNGTNDIYEWRDGRLRLVTDGFTPWPEGPGEPSLGGVTPDATNIFFTLGADLTGYEVDQTSQLYDARVGGGFPPPARPPAPCSEDACQGPLLAPPALPVPGSASFSGPANSQPAAAAPKARKHFKPHRRKRRPKRPRRKRPHNSRTVHRHRGGAK